MDVDAWDECQTVTAIVVEDMSSLRDRVREKCVKPVPSLSHSTGYPRASDSHSDEDRDRYNVRVYDDWLRHPSEMSVEERVEVKKHDVEEHKTVRDVVTFATATGISLNNLKQLAKGLRLAVTQTKRQSASFEDRVAFGFQRRLRQFRPAAQQDYHAVSAVNSWEHPERAIRK